MKNTQRNAVFVAICNVLGTNEFSGPVTLPKDKRDSVQAILCEGFRAGTIEFENTPSNAEKLASDAKLKAYVSGLVSNWIRKDERLNGGGKYEIKNPGSRAGQSDEQMKTLRALKKQFAGTDKEAVVDAQIEKRRMEIASTKSKSVALTPEQIAALPADVRESLGL
jgi:hypothetical protein